MAQLLTGKPEVVFRSAARRPKVSVILIDWNARESFHSLEYLNRQTAKREDFELIWVEFYSRKPEPLLRMVATPGLPMIDQWIVLGYPEQLTYHKHRAYNAGLLAARGDIVVICDSDAMFSPTFIESVIKGFDETAYSVIHLDEVRNISHAYYPFNYPPFEKLLGEGVINWAGIATCGLCTEVDRLHRANYGACFAARRSDVLGIGGADEHIDYLGFCCGPYEMTFRLQNRGRRERWLTTEFLYHTWHPNQTSFNSDYQGPQDGRYLSLRALHARSTGQVQPYQMNPGFRSDARDRLPEFLRFVAEHPEPLWTTAARPTEPPDFVYHVDNDYRGFDLVIYRDEWFALPCGRGPFDPARAACGEYSNLLRSPDEVGIRAQVERATPHYQPPRPPGRVRQFVRNVLSEPLHTFPRRALRATKRQLLKVAS